VVWSIALLLTHDGYHHLCIESVSKTRLHQLRKEGLWTWTPEKDHVLRARDIGYL
jgi:hypothetical protein